MEKVKLDKLVEEALTDNEYLRGDNSKSTRSYLIGWIGSLIRQHEGRKASEDEVAYIQKVVDDFLRGF